MELKEKIQFYLEDRLLGETDAWDHSTDDQRNQCAYNLGILKFDNIKFVRESGIRLDFNDIKYFNKPYGTYSGEEYARKLSLGYYNK